MTGAGTIGAIIATMVIVALVEGIVPLHRRGRWNRDHLAPNLALTALGLATNLLLNGTLVSGIEKLHSRGIGILPWIALPRLASAVTAFVVLDFSFWVCHVAMHRVPGLWRYHRVHHSDPAVDVTTTIRQHPGEGVIRYAFTAAFAVVLGPSPEMFAAYRACSALNGLLEHGNVRAPRWLDDALSRVTTWPGMHKVHHSRRPTETDTNYGNIFSVFDRLFGTFTPPARGRNVAYGLDEFDQPAMQTILGLLAMPFQDRTRQPATASGDREPKSPAVIAGESSGARGGM